MLALLLVLLRPQCIQVPWYLDVLLLKDFSAKVTWKRWSTSFKIFWWLINFKMSALGPSHSQAYLRLILDTAQAKIFLPLEKIACLWSNGQTPRPTRHPSLLHMGSGSYGGLLLRKFPLSVHARPLKFNFQAYPFSGLLTTAVYLAENIPGMVDFQPSPRIWEISPSSYLESNNRCKAGTGSTIPWLSRETGPHRIWYAQSTTVYSIQILGVENWQADFFLSSNSGLGGSVTPTWDLPDALSEMGNTIWISWPPNSTKSITGLLSGPGIP